MSGKAIVTIRDKQWQVNVASTPTDLQTGLSGVPSMPPGTGMLFDTGIEWYITVTTEDMLFPIDIIFISENLNVTEVAFNVGPGSWGVSRPARYFLEVNAGEADDIVPGDTVNIELLATTPSPGNTGTSWITPVVTFAGVLMMGAMMTNMSKTMTKAMLSKPKEKPLIYGPRGEQISPQIIRMNGSFGFPLPHVSIISGDRVRWYGTTADKDLSAEVTGIQGLSRQKLKMALGTSFAKIMNPVEGVELPFAGSSDGNIWWLATVNYETVELEVTGVKGLSDIQIENAFANSVAVISKYDRSKAGKPTRNDVEVHSWVERDRLLIWLEDKRTGDIIAEWRDEEAVEMFDQGWFERGDIRHQSISGREFEESVLDYAESVGLLVGMAPKVIENKPRKKQPKKSDLEFLPDSPEFLAYTLEDIGYRDKIDTAFQNAIARVKQGG